VGLAHEPKDVQAVDAVVHLELDEGRDPLVVEPPGDVEGCRDDGDPPASAWVTIGYPGCEGSDTCLYSTRP
jgi:hypothetical protein